MPCRSAEAVALLVVGLLTSCGQPVAEEHGVEAAAVHVAATPPRCEVQCSAGRCSGSLGVTTRSLTVNATFDLANSEDLASGASLLQWLTYYEGETFRFVVVDHLSEFDTTHVVPHDDYRLRTTWVEYPLEGSMTALSPYAGAKPIELLADESTASYTFSVHPEELVRVSGTVDLEGEPTAVLFVPHGWHRESGVPDVRVRDGAFTANVLAGTYDVYVTDGILERRCAARRCFFSRPDWRLAAAGVDIQGTEQALDLSPAPDAPGPPGHPQAIFMPEACKRIDPSPAHIVQFRLDYTEGSSGWLGVLRVVPSGATTPSHCSFTSPSNRLLLPDGEWQLFYQNYLPLGDDVPPVSAPLRAAFESTPYGEVLAIEVPIDPEIELLVELPWTIEFFVSLVDAEGRAYPGDLQKRYEGGHRAWFNVPDGTYRAIAHVDRAPGVAEELGCVEVVGE